MQVPWEWDDWAEIEFMGGSSFRTFSEMTSRFNHPWFLPLVKNVPSA